MGPPWRINPMTHHTISKRSYHRATSHSSTEGSQYFNTDILIDKNVCKHGRKERNVLFNEVLNTLYLQLYGIRHGEGLLRQWEETRCLHMGYSFRLTARLLSYAPSHWHDSIYQAFVMPVMENWLVWEIALRVHMRDRSNDPSHHEWTLPKS